jgi:hypothetical protein
VDLDDTDREQASLPVLGAPSARRARLPEKIVNAIRADEISRQHVR